MPPRIARSSLPASAPKSGKNKHKKRSQDAFAIASHSAPSTTKPRSARLGVVEDDKQKQKRRRDDEEDEGGDSDGGEKLGGKSRKRAKAGDEDVEYGSDSEGNEWIAGGLGSGDSDSDLDSDEAFGESDEERFAGFAFRGGSSDVKPKSTKKNKMISNGGVVGDFDLGENDEENEEEEESDFGDEGVDLATMLDDQVDEALGSKDMTDHDMDGDSASEDTGSDDEDTFSDLSADDADTEEDEDEHHARLQDFVEALGKKTPQDKARIVGDEDGGLTVDDLLADADLDKATLATFKPKRKSRAPQTLTAPLPKRQQDRIDREIATEKAKAQLDRWRDTVMHNRRAEFLQFPLKNPDEAAPVGIDTFVHSHLEQPQTELEHNIQKIMEESGMVSTHLGANTSEDAEQKILKAEELATNKLPVEEVLARRAELRRARELLFREEVKAKRIAKIKSRSYRRVHRKERERQAEKERALLDPDGIGLPMNEDEKEIADRRRAAARMGTKHRDSKWAKSLKATDRAVWDESAREGAVEQARRQEDLRKRIVGQDMSDDERSELSADDSEGDEEDGVMFRKLGNLAQSGAVAPEKGIGAMKFMLAADERRKAANDETIAQLRREIAGEDSEQDADDSIGRAIFGPATKADKTTGPKPARPELEEGERSDDEEDQDQEHVQRPKTVKQNRPKGILKKPISGIESVPKGIEDRRQRDEKKTTGSDQTSSWISDPAPAKPSPWTSESKKCKSRQNHDREPAPMIKNAVTSDQSISGVSKPSLASAATDADSTAGWITIQAPDGSEIGSDAEQAAPLLSVTAERNSLQHRAFAGDDAAAQFAADKAAMVSAEEEKEISTALPGWGTWTGEALSKNARRAAERQRHNPLYKKKLPGGVNADARKDRHRDNVIVSEKSDRKGKVYLAPVLPHEFERKEEYERSLRLPIGAEWGTKEVVQRNVKPRVVVKPGRIVEAMERPRV